MFGREARRRKEEQRQLEQRKENLLAAARNNDTAGVVKYFMRRPVVFDACLAAVEAGSVDALKALLRRNLGFDFSEFRDQDVLKAKRLVNAARGSDKADALLTVLFAANETTECGKLHQSTFICPEISHDILRCILLMTPSTFETAIDVIGLEDTDRLKFILAFLPKDGSGQGALDKALSVSAERNDVEKAQMLLDKGANANHAEAQALQNAAMAGHMDMVCLLLLHVDLLLYGNDVSAQVEHAHPDLAKLIADATAICFQEEESPFVALNKNILEERQTLSGGKTLTTIFNFETRQQHNAIETPQGTEKMTTVNFKDIDAGVLEKMRRKLDGLNAAKRLVNKP